MSQSSTRPFGLIDYDRAAAEYQASLPLEHYMEGRLQATQREITLASLALLRRVRLDVFVYNELLVQYFYRGNLRQVVPDNMVVLSATRPAADRSYNVELEPAKPFWMLEYVSAGAEQKRKDYEASYRKYERELKTPYYLVFDPETQDLRVYRRHGRAYVQLPQNEAGRYTVRELELELGLQSGWVRFWYQGELLELPDKLQDQIDELKNLLLTERQRRDEEKRRADAEFQRAELLSKQAEDERLQKEEQRVRADAAEAEAARLRELLRQMQSARGNGTKK